MSAETNGTERRWLQPVELPSSGDSVANRVIFDNASQADSDPSSPIYASLVRERGDPADAGVAATIAAADVRFWQNAADVRRDLVTDAIRIDQETKDDALEIVRTLKQFALDAIAKVDAVIGTSEIDWFDPEKTITSAGPPAANSSIPRLESVPSGLDATH